MIQPNGEMPPRVGRSVQHPSYTLRTHRQGFLNQDVFATLYRNLGIDPMTATIEDQAGRPQYLLDRREPVVELA